MPDRQRGSVYLLNMSDTRSHKLQFLYSTLILACYLRTTDHLMKASTKLFLKGTRRMNVWALEMELLFQVFCPQFPKKETVRIFSLNTKFGI